MGPQHSPFGVPPRLRSRARAVRQGARRFRNHLLWARLRVRNVVRRSPVTGTTPVVVSLTTYGRRIDAAAIAVESIARGSHRPSRMILWLDDAALFESRPASLRRLERRGLEVRLTDNLGPHTKYYPFVASETDHRLPLVTADDDIMYPRNWLRRLHSAFLENPSTINCHWASEILFTGDRPASYHTWPHCRDTSARFSNFGLGVSGVIYPPSMLAELAARGTAFRTLSPTADDVWLHWVALRAAIPVRQISPVPRHFATIPGTQAQALMYTNDVEGSGNDAWIRELYSERDCRTIGGAFAVRHGAPMEGADGLSQDLTPDLLGRDPVHR